MKKLLLLMVLLPLVAFGQTKPHWSQVQGKPVVSIADYANEADPFAAAVAAAQALGTTARVTILIDDKKYTTTTPVNMVTDLAIVGWGPNPHPNHQAIHFDNCSGFLLNSTATSSGRSLELRNVHISGTKKAGANIPATSTSYLDANVGVYSWSPDATYSAGVFDITNCVIQGFDVGVAMGGNVNYASAVDTSINRNTIGVLAQDNGASTNIWSANAITFTRCAIVGNYFDQTDRTSTGNGGNGIWWNKGVGNVFRDCSIERNGTKKATIAPVNNRQTNYPHFQVYISGYSTVVFDGGYTEDGYNFVHGKYAKVTISNQFNTGGTSWWSLDGTLDYRGDTFGSVGTDLDMGYVSEFTPTNATLSVNLVVDPEVGQYATATTNAAGGSNSWVISRPSEDVTAMSLYPSPTAGQTAGEAALVTFWFKTNSISPVGLPNVSVTYVGSGTSDSTGSDVFAMASLLTTNTWHKIQYVSRPRYNSPYLTAKFHTIKTIVQLKEAAEDLSGAERIVQFTEPTVRLFSGQRKPPRRHPPLPESEIFLVDGVLRPSPNNISVAGTKMSYVTMADNASMTLQSALGLPEGANVPTGYIQIYAHGGEGFVGMVAVQSGSTTGTPSIVHDHRSAMSTTKDNASTFNIYNDPGNSYATYIQNKRGEIVYLTFFYFGLNRLGE